MTAFIRAALGAAALIGGSSAALQAQTTPTLPAPQPAPTVCPSSHYECGPGVCCPKIGG